MVDKDFRPLSFWSFNEDMQDDEIRKQIHDFKEQGFGGFYMHARAGMTLEYLGKEWMHACRVAVEEAKKLGMYAWLYDENGWPSGFAGGLVPALGDDYTAKHLYFVTEYPGEGKYMAAYKKNYDYADDKKCNNAYLRVTGEEEKNAELYCCIGFLRGYADLLSYEAMSKFIEFTHERYFEEFGEYFGNVIPGIFTDEPQLVGKFPYTICYPVVFKEKYGYDFWDNAWMLNFDSDEFAEFKYQASALIADLFTKNFTTQIEEWCQAHNILFTGHYSNEDGLCNQTSANYDLMRQYSIMGRPGIDFLGRRLTSPVLVKQISDATYLAGKNRITSESFGCCGWDVTFNDLMWIADWEAAFGINSIVTHISAYSMKGRRKRDYPAFFSYQEPWWDIFGKVSEQITTTNEFLSEGRRHINILLVHPTTGMWCNLAGKNTFSDKSRYISNQFRVTVENLLNLQRDFLIISEDELKKFEVKNGKLIYGDIEAGVLIVPDTPSLNSTTWTLMDDFSKVKGELIFINNMPEMVEGKTIALNKMLDTQKHSHIAENKTIIENRLGLMEKYFQEKSINDEVTITDGYNDEAANGIIFTTRYQKDGSVRAQIMNPSRFEKKKVFLKTCGKLKVYIFNNMDSDICLSEKASMYDGKNTYTEFVLEPTESVRVVLCEIEGRECSGVGDISDSTSEHGASVSEGNCKIDGCTSDGISGNGACVLETDCGIATCRMGYKLPEKRIFSNVIDMRHVENMDRNALTIDKCDVYINGERILKDVLPAGCADDVYEQAYKTGKEAKVRLEYFFEADFAKEIPRDFSLVAEDDGLTNVELNGVSVFTKKVGWWIDKSFGEFDVNGLITNGTNVIALEFDVKKHEESDEGEDFEGYRNKFFYSIEPENVYIKGSFDVAAEGEGYEDVESIYMTGPFTITDKNEKCHDELSAQGLWFYSGNVSYKGKFIATKNDDCRLYINISDMNEVAAKVVVNGHDAGIIFRTPYRIDITDFVLDGENSLQIILYGNNRNLLGPHHHQMGNPHMLGVPTFLGKKCFTDFIYPELTDDDVSMPEYAFRKFGLGDVMLEGYKID